jgi:hypothetical protein
MKRRLMLSALPAWMVATGARADGASAAAPPAVGRKYVMMSLIGDQLTYVQKLGDEVGSNLNRNEHREVPMTDAPFDITALQVMAGALPAFAPGATMSFLKGSSPDYFSDQLEWFSGGSLVLPEHLKNGIAGEHGDYLLLLTKWRGATVVTNGTEARGQGKLSGLGFYSDPSQEMTHGQGFTAPYVYIKLSLVDLSTSKLVREFAVHTATYRDSRSFKLAPLQDMLIDDVQHAMSEVFKPA